MPAQYVIKVWKGNTLTLPLRFRTTPGNAPIDLTGSTIIAIIRWAGGQIRKESGEPGFTITDAEDGLVEVFLTSAETRQIPTGSTARYEIERRIGSTETTLLYGNIHASEWVNDDSGS